VRVIFSSSARTAVHKGSHPWDRHQGLGRTIFKSDLHQLLVQSSNLPIDKPQKLDIFSDNPRPIAAQFVSSGDNGMHALKSRLWINVSLGVNRTQFVDHGGTLTH
jgi:hypothetical protein